MSCSDSDKKCAAIPSYTTTFTVEKPGTTTDSFGQVDDDVWVKVGTLRGRVITRGGREQFRFTHLEATVQRIVMVPYTSDAKIPLPTYRLVLGTRKWNITTAYRVNEVEREVLIAVTELI